MRVRQTPSGPVQPAGVAAGEQRLVTPRRGCPRPWVGAEASGEALAAGHVRDPRAPGLPKPVPLTSPYRPALATIAATMMRVSHTTEIRQRTRPYHCLAPANHSSLPSLIPSAPQSRNHLPTRAQCVAIFRSSASRPPSEARLPREPISGRLSYQSVLMGLSFKRGSCPGTLRAKHFIQAGSGRIAAGQRGSEVPRRHGPAYSRRPALNCLSRWEQMEGTVRCNHRHRMGSSVDAPLSSVDRGSRLSEKPTILPKLTRQMHHGSTYFVWGLTMGKVTNPAQQYASVPVQKMPLLTF
jgi:hypothetical protein